MKEYVAFHEAFYIVQFSIVCQIYYTEIFLYYKDETIVCRIDYTKQSLSVIKYRLQVLEANT